MKDLEADQATVAVMSEHLSAMQSAHKADPVPSAEVRIDRLRRLERALLGAKDELIAAMQADFCHRSAFEADLADITMTLGEIRENRKSLKRWMKPRRVGVPKHFLPARGRVLPQPKGVAGIIAPWNYPVHLAIGPLAAALAAGNRAMMKPSELSPRTSDRMARMIAEAFDPLEVTVVTGGPDVAVAFSALPFDHLMFTGSTKVGRMVAEAAARNLTPVTLELGGKSPTIVGESADLAYSSQRIALGKTANGGQTCVAPDYVLVPRALMADFAEMLAGAMRKLYPAESAGRDYTGLISERHFARLQSMLAEAEDAGTQIIRLDDLAIDPARRQFAPALILDPDPGLTVMQEEIFGPLLPIVPYDSRAEAMAYVAARPAPLALYIFTDSREERDAWMEKSLSGGAGVNETCFHAAALPFGGVGESGMGAYRGQRGFDTFSHLKSVFYQPKRNGAFLFDPPITDFKRRIARMLQRIV
ncbi:MAG: aldehyde dehydrogenase family protein [Pseudomonadota bacterium]